MAVMWEEDITLEALRLRLLHQAMEEAEVSLHQDLLENSLGFCSSSSNKLKWDTLRRDLDMANHRNKVGIMQILSIHRIHSKALLVKSFMELVHQELGMAEWTN